MGRWAEARDCKKMQMRMGSKERMRRTFAEVLMSADVDVIAEYRSLCTMFFASYFQGLFQAVFPYREIANEFPNMDIHGTAVSIRDFNDRHGFRFQKRADDSI